MSGQKFESKEIEFGLNNNQKQCCYTYIDMDLDGDLDIITRSADGTVNIHVNGTHKGHSMVFEFHDKQGNHFGIGNKITIYYGEDDELHQVREIKASGGFASFDAPFAHFGLGDYDHVIHIDISWSNGDKTQINHPFTADKKYIIKRKLR